MQDTELATNEQDHEKLMNDLQSVEESLKRIKAKNQKLTQTINDRQKVVDKQKSLIQQKTEKINLIS